MTYIQLTYEESLTLSARKQQDESILMLVFYRPICIFKYDYFDVGPVAEASKTRPKHQKNIADTISVMHDELHAFRLGVKLHKGIEF